MGGKLVYIMFLVIVNQIDTQNLGFYAFEELTECKSFEEYIESIIQEEQKFLNQESENPINFPIMSLDEFNKFNEDDDFEYEGNIIIKDIIDDEFGKKVLYICSSGLPDEVFTKYRWTGIEIN